MRLIDANALLKQLKTLSFPIELDSNVMIMFVHDVVNAITNAPTVQREGWVSVEDRLPDSGQKVLIWCYNTVLVGNYIRSNHSFSLFKVSGNASLYHAFYWQPLPEAPADTE